LHILVLGAAGMVGRKLTERLLRDGRLGSRDITRMTLQDVVAPATPAKSGFPVDTVTCDFAVAGAAEKLVADRPDVIFHLAAIVSGEAELDFDKGYRINLDGTRMLLDAIRLAGGGYKPRVVFTSSIAVFGAPFPDAIGDEFFQTPLLSYGTQKAIGELLLADYSRRGFMDGIGIRLPTICIRPGLPTRRLPASFPTSCANRSPARKRCCRCRRTSATGMPRHARRSASWFTPRPWIRRRRVRAATSPCPAFRQPSAKRSPP